MALPHRRYMERQQTLSNVPHEYLALRPKEVAEALRVSLRTLARWREDGSGPPYISLGANNSVLYDVNKLKRWIEANSRP